MGAGGLGLIKVVVEIKQQKHVCGTAAGRFRAGLLLGTRRISIQSHAGPLNWFVYICSTTQDIHKSSHPLYRLLP